MPTKYTPATFQPTVRPSWAGILTYISEKERSDILEAIIKFPEKTDIESKFWEDTIRPDLQEQYEKFIKTCESRGRGARTYWGEHKENISYTYDKHKDNFLKGQGQDKGKDKNKDNISITYPTHTEKMVEIEEGKFFMDDTVPEYKELLSGLSDDEVEKLWRWIMKKYEYQKLSVSKIQSMIINFKNKKEA